MLNIHSFRKPQIINLIAKKTFTKIPAEYANFVEVFFPDLAFELPKHIKINNHIIKLVDSKQPPFSFIYSLEPIELEILKAYIETNLANKFIRSFKLPADAPIFLD